MKEIHVYCVFSARYQRLIKGFMVLVEEIKSPAIARA
jgi:hypothetical protein